MPTRDDDISRAALQEHLDRRLNDVFASIKDLAKDVGDLRVAVGKVETNMAVTSAQHQQIQHQLELFGGRQTSFEEKLADLLRIKDYGRGLLFPLAFVGGLIVLGIGDWIKLYVDKHYK